MSETFETNIKGKLNSIPSGLQEQERQPLKWERGNKKILMETAKVVRTAIFGNNPIPENLQIEDQHPVGHILAILPEEISAKGIPYHITIRPEAYLNSYIQLSYLFERYLLKPFNAIPLSTSTVPLYLILDTNVLLKQILGNIQPTKINEETKPGYWSQVFCLNNKAFKRKS
ncbi:hypothetical protein HDU92_004583 [Lobulomyces angularis]|nr:hypothetical protein HDU92_004583 [Lobulomyces angularis]